MLVQHKQEGNRGIFFIAGEDNEVEAELVYSLQHPRLIAEHTEVDEELRDQNRGFELVNALVKFARTHHLKIVPLCPFVKSVMDKKPDFGDVLSDK